ncbi:hypothetical protein F2Q68_00015571 [Brassica cretica]|uniref:Uncharacterized protein n=3 Tax=Brassica cretica TaxID=69181 RepID=A0ABQ7F7H8_BRACR|nr:hypothetical protein F2Q68_00015571 [Brassica cretica]KAF3610969.1 hypothetical protein DY000_02048180 [Brassica cretica]
MESTVHMKETTQLAERSDTDSLLAAACGKGTRFYRPFTRAKLPSIDNKAITSIDNHPKPPSNVRETAKRNIDYLTPDDFGIFRDPEGYAREMDGHALQVSREDIADILQMANGAENLFKQQRNTPEHQQRVTNEFYDTAGGVDDRQHTRPSIYISIPTSIDIRPEFGKRAYDCDGIRSFHWEQKDEYGVYRDDHAHAEGVDGHIIHVSKDDIRNLRDEHCYICLPEHARSFTQTKLVPEIYTKDEIDEMLYGICGAQEKSEDDFEMKLDGVYYPLNDSISWLTTCMEEMRQDIVRMQAQRAARATTPASIEINISTSIDDDPSQSNPTKYKPDSYTRAEVNQMLEEIYRTLGAAEDRLERICHEIYFPWDITISSLTSQTEAMQREIVEIQRYIMSRPEASKSIDKAIKISTDNHSRTTIDEATPSNQGQLVTKLTSNMSDTINHDEEI